MAPTIAPNTAKPVRSQNSSRYSGAISSTTSRTSQAAMPASRPGVTRRERPGSAVARPVGADGLAVRGAVASDTGQLPGAEEPGRADQQDGEHHDVRHHRAEPAAQEGELVLVPGGKRLGDADDEAADERT